VTSGLPRLVPRRKNSPPTVWGTRSARAPFLFVAPI
jgi:hypothetical protein